MVEKWVLLCEAMRFMSFVKTLLKLGLLCAVAFAYYSWPKYRLEKLAKATAAGDQAAISEFIDRKSLRDAAVEQFVRQMAKASEEGRIRGRPAMVISEERQTAAIRRVKDSCVADLMIRELSSPSNFTPAMVYRNGRPAWRKEGWRGPTTYQIVDELNGVTFVFGLRGLGEWKLCDIDITVGIRDYLAR